MLYSKTDFLFSLLHATQPGSPLLFFDFHDKSTEKSLYIVEFIGGLGQREVVYLKENEQFIFDCTVTLFFKVFWLSYFLNFPLPTCHLRVQPLAILLSIPSQLSPNCCYFLMKNYLALSKF